MEQEAKINKTLKKSTSEDLLTIFDIFAIPQSKPSTFGLRKLRVFTLQGVFCWNGARWWAVKAWWAIWASGRFSGDLKMPRHLSSNLEASGSRNDAIPPVIWSYVGPSHRLHGLKEVTASHDCLPNTLIWFDCYTFLEVKLFFTLWCLYNLPSLSEGQVNVTFESLTVPPVKNLARWLIMTPCTLIRYLVNFGLLY